MRILTHCITLLLLIIFAGCSKNDSQQNQATGDEEIRLILTDKEVASGPQHTQHARIFGQYAPGFNTYILQAIDLVQGTAMDGGGYFTGITAQPPESPIGYDLTLFNKPLLDAPRKTSYCSGSTYTVFIEALNLMQKDSLKLLSPERYEALRMQEPDGGRREDGIKFWGHWNANGYGNHFALVQYSGMGKVIDPENARPGDFLNISWKSGNGHSVVFLGWYINDQHEKCVVYWSSQTRTNGMGDEIIPVSRIREVMFVRLVAPEKLFTFDVTKTVDPSVQGSKIKW